MSDSASRSSPVFMDSAEDLVARMGTIGTAEAAAIASEAQQLVDTFRGWLTHRPADDVRVASIRRMLDLHRRAMDYLAAHPGLVHHSARPGATTSGDDDDHFEPRPLPMRSARR